MGQQALPAEGCTLLAASWRIQVSFGEGSAQSVYLLARCSWSPWEEGTGCQSGP